MYHFIDTCNTISMCSLKWHSSHVDLDCCVQTSWLLYVALLSWSRSYFTTESVSLSVSMSGYRATLWDLRPDIISCRNVVVWNLQSCIFGAPPPTRRRGRLAYWSVFHVSLSWYPEADPSVYTASNNSCIAAIIGYHGNSVYRAVAWIPICLTVTSVVIW
jgi:hypothetical protein